MWPEFVDLDAISAASGTTPAADLQQQIACGTGITTRKSPRLLAFGRMPGQENMMLGHFSRTDP
jgi:hypothetical protein